MKLTVKHILYIFVALFPFALAQTGGETGGTAMGGEIEGLVTVQSTASVDETLANLEAALEENGLITVAVVDHSANAENAGLELPPTRLVIFGNPNVGTPLMQAARTVAIDLPQKMLIYEDEAGDVFVAYNDPQYLAERHGLSGVDEPLAMVTNALSNLANAAAGQ